MTTYRVTSDRTGHHLIGSWPDLPERASHEVATFEELKLAGAARSVLNAASCYRWRRWLQLLDEGVFSEAQAGRDRTLTEGPAASSLEQGSGSRSEPSWLSGLPTNVVLGDVPMSEYLEARIAELLADPGSEPEPEPMEPDSLVFVHRVPLGNLRPLLWRDWRAHLQAGEHDRLSAELDEDLAAAATGELVGRARQIAWYLSAQMLIDEDRMAPAAQEGEGGEAGASAFQKSLVQLLGDLIGLDVQSTAVDADPDNEGLLRVHAPSTVVGFWFDGACWYYGCPDPDSPVGEPTNWLHAGTLPSGTSIGDLAAFITEGVGREGWPFQVDPPDDETSSLGKRRWGTR